MSVMNECYGKVLFTKFITQWHHRHTVGVGEGTCGCHSKSSESPVYNFDTTFKVDIIFECKVKDYFLNISFAQIACH